MRYKLLYNHTEILGETRVFDGIQLFLPWKLPQQVRGSWDEWEGGRRNEERKDGGREVE